MSDVSILARLLNGVTRNIDLSSNALVVGSLKVGSVSPTELTKAILDNLVALQNGTDFANGTNAHTHDGRYFTESELGSATSSSGSDLIGDDNTYSNFTPAAATVKGALSGIDAALASAGGSDFSDAMFRISDDGDSSKKIAFQASGISASTVRTITMPDADVNLADANNAILKDGSRTFTADQPMGSHKLTGLSAGSAAGHSVRYEQAILASGANAFAADQSMGGFKLTNLADPVSGTDAVNVNYLSARLNGLKPKESVRVATTAAGTLASSFENGDTVDGVTLATGDRILIKDQAAPETNGIYTVNASGAPTRAADFDSLSPIDEINGAWVAVREGTANAGKIYVQYGTVATLETDAINFEYFNPIASLIGGDMITFTSSTFSVDLATVSGLESSNPGNAAGQLRVKLEASNPSLQINGSNELGAKVDGSTIESSASGLRVKDAGITLAKLASNSVDENKIVSTALSSTGALTGGSGSKLAWNPDGSTLEINANAARIKDAGVTLAKLASNSVDENKITTSVAGNGLSGGGGSALAVNVDDSTIEINSDSLRVKDAGITAAKLATGAFDQLTITGGAGSAAAVQNAPQVKRTLVAGESFAANTSFLVRFAINGETAGRVYKADKDASSSIKYNAIGVALSTGAVSAGQNIDVVVLGEYTLGSSDSAFASADLSKEVYLTSSGAFSITAPTAVNDAVYVIGYVQTTTKIWIDGKDLRGIN